MLYLCCLDVEIDDKGQPTKLEPVHFLNSLFLSIHWTYYINCIYRILFAWSLKSLIVVPAFINTQQNMKTSIWLISKYLPLQSRGFITSTMRIIFETAVLRLCFCGLANGSQGNSCEIVLKVSTTLMAETDCTNWCAYYGCFGSMRIHFWWDKNEK